MLFGSYRRGDANDPDAYVAAVTAVLSIYDTDVIREVTDPRTGIGTSEKFSSFMPNAGELKVYCDGVAARRANFKRLGDLPKPLPASSRISAPPITGPGCYASTFIQNNNALYSEVVKWAERAEETMWRYGNSNDGRAGLWFNHEEWKAKRRAAQLPTPAPVSQPAAPEPSRDPWMEDGYAEAQVG